MHAILPSTPVYQWEEKVADTVPLQPPGDLSILNRTFIEKAVLGMLKHPSAGRFSLLPIDPSL